MYVNDIATKGLVSGYSDGTFKPNASVSRIDAIVFMARLYPSEIVSSTYAQNKDKWAKKLSDNQLADSRTHPAFVPNGTHFAVVEETDGYLLYFVVAHCFLDFFLFITV